jgi:WD40 repeat protein
MDLKTYKNVAVLEHKDLFIPTGGCSFDVSSDGTFLAIGGQGGQVFVFNLKKNSLEEIYVGEHSAAVVGCAWDPSHTSRLASID